MHQYKGKLILHTGSMFSGKTSSLEKDINRFKIAGYNTTVFKPAIDTRYSEDEIVSHDKIVLSANRVSNFMEILPLVEKFKSDVIGIDEVHFFRDDPSVIVSQLDKLLNCGVTVVVAGLDMDFTATPFEIVKELMPRADYVYKHHAVCTKCGNDAWVSHRKTEEKDRIVLGAYNEYEPLCRSCYYQGSEENGK